MAVQGEWTSSHSPCLTPKDLLEVSISVLIRQDIPAACDVKTFYRTLFTFGVFLRFKLFIEQEETYFTAQIIYLDATFSVVPEIRMDD